MDKDIALMAHLMRRAGFGASRDELEARAAKGYEATVEELLDPEAHGIPPFNEGILYRHLQGFRNPGNPLHMQGNWMYRMINTPQPLVEKVVLFWHHVFATGYSKVDNGNQMLAQIATFRKCGMGNYREILLELSRDPAMLFWLDNNENHKYAPNENWGRELLELFSMGQGNYTEEDVKECARAFTGWTVSNKLPRNPYGRFLWDFVYDANDHDDTEKYFLGHRGNFNGEDIIDIVIRQPATARFIARHLYNFFVADEVQVPSWQDVAPRDPVAINLLGDAFISSGYDMRSTLRVLFNSDFFQGRKRLVRQGEESGGADRRHHASSRRLPRPQAGHHRPGGGVQLPGAGPAGPAQRGRLAHGRRVDRQRRAASSHQLRRRPDGETGASRREGHHRKDVGPRSAGRRGGMVDGCLDLMGPVRVEDATREELIDHVSKSEPANGNGGESRSFSDRVVGAMQIIASTREYQFG